MNPALKQRLVGAALLVALAVIFLPMLLDGSGARERLNADIAIPDKPEAPESRLDQPEPGTTAVAESDGAATVATSAADGERTASGSAGARDDEPASAPEPRAEGETESEPAPEPEPEPTEAAEAESGPDEGWIVQVGSFRREANAIVLRDQLRQQGYDAHSDRTVSQGQTWWRVRVGPVARRSEGEALERRIEAARGSDALLMGYP